MCRGLTDLQKQMLARKQASVRRTVETTGKLINIHAVVPLGGRSLPEMTRRPRSSGALGGHGGSSAGGGVDGAGSGGGRDGGQQGGGEGAGAGGSMADLEEAVAAEAAEGNRVGGGGDRGFDALAGLRDVAGGSGRIYKADMLTESRRRVTAKAAQFRHQLARDAARNGFTKHMSREEIEEGRRRRIADRGGNAPPPTLDAHGRYVLMLAGVRHPNSFQSLAAFVNVLCVSPRVQKQGVVVDRSFSYSMVPTHMSKTGKAGASK